MGVVMVEAPAGGRMWAGMAGACLGGGIAFDPVSDLRVDEAEA